MYYTFKKRLRARAPNCVKTPPYCKKGAAPPLSSCRHPCRELAWKPGPTPRNSEQARMPTFSNEQSVNRGGRRRTQNFLHRSPPSFPHGKDKCTGATFRHALAIGFVSSGSHSQFSLSEICHA